MSNGNTPIIVYAAGTWDLFHIGHLNILKRAKGFGDKLVVGVSTDELVAQYKKRKPVIPFEQRMAIVEAIRYVDLAVPQTDLDKTTMLKKLNADVLVAGDDWDRLQGQEWMEANNKKVIFLPRTSDTSSSELRSSIQNDGLAEAS